MRPKAFWTFMIIAGVGIVAVFVLLAVASTQDGKPSDTRCVHIGNNPCFPVKK
jgi:hypothetical protein